MMALEVIGELSIYDCMKWFEDEAFPHGTWVGQRRYCEAVRLPNPQLHPVQNN